MTRYGSPAAYLETGILSSTPEQLVPTIYEHLLLHLRRGGLHIRKRNIEAKFESLSRAHALVAELLSSLDFEAGGELARRLASLYAYWMKEIVVCGRDLDSVRLESLVQMVASLHESWEEAARLGPTQAASGHGRA